MKDNSSIDIQWISSNKEKPKKIKPILYIENDSDNAQFILYWDKMCKNIEFHWTPIYFEQDKIAAQRRVFEWIWDDKETKEFEESWSRFLEDDKEN